MTEAEWLACADPQPMLEFLGSRPSDRKLRLFACACCRKIWHLLDDGGRRAVEVAELFADKRVKMREVIAARTTALTGASHANQAAWAAYWALSSRSAVSIWNVHTAASAAEAFVATRTAVGSGSEREAAFNRVQAAAGGVQAELLRHVIGSPFHPAVAATDWPRNVNQLAEALYAGADCAFALHDALLDAGHPALAEHFREHEHPKGCWWLDAILGKE